MKKVISIVIFFIMLALFYPISGNFIQQEPIINMYDGNLSGYVFDNDMNPIQGVRICVYFHETYEEDFSDSMGFYHVTNIPICYCLKNATASKQGYSNEWVLLSIVQNTTYDFILTKLYPIPDLDCNEVLYLDEDSFGETVAGNITVENIGEQGSLLNWEILSFPDWGTWTFDPDFGVGLLSGDFVTIGVELILPEEYYEGEIVIVNSDDTFDFCIIDIVITPQSPPRGYFYIGTISDTEISDEIIIFHADFVLVFGLNTPANILKNVDIVHSNNYFGHIGERFILARIVD